MKSIILRFNFKKTPAILSKPIPINEPKIEEIRLFFWRKARTFLILTILN